MPEWQFDCVIPGAPIGKGRPRATTMVGTSSVAVNCVDPSA